LPQRDWNVFRLFLPASDGTVCVLNVTVWESLFPSPFNGVQVGLLFVHLSSLHPYTKSDHAAVLRTYCFRNFLISYFLQEPE
jgi:hypothetical protein